MATTVTKTIDDAIYEARLMVNDSSISAGVVVPTRNADAVYVQYLNSALRAVYSVRPDAFIYMNTGIITTTLAPTYSTSDLQTIDGVANVTPPSPATPFPCDDRQFFFPVVAYMAGRIELADDEYTDTSRSSLLLAAFKQQLTGM